MKTINRKIIGILAALAMILSVVSGGSGRAALVYAEEGVPESVVSEEPAADPDEVLAAEVINEDPASDPEKEPADGESPESGAADEKTVPAEGTSGPVDGKTPAAEEPAGGNTDAAFSQSRTVDGVTVTVSAGEGVFPEGAVLSVAGVPSSRAEEAVAAEREADRNVAVSYTFDIKVLGADGNELQPADGQSVKVSFSTSEVADANLDTNVYHVADDGSAESLDIDVSGITAEAETDGFSYYTVEFTYGDLRYILPGDGSVPVSVILDTVGLKGIAETVRVSSETLFSASNESGEWVITSHEPFSTNEKLFVTIAGIEYEITVTDAQDKIVYIDADGIQKSKNPGEYTIVENIYTTELTGNNAWYVVAAGEYVTLQNVVTVSGSVHLIICDGATLNCSAGIKVEGTDSLTIYAQSTGDNKGKLIATGEKNQAGIGGSASNNSGIVMINGCKITTVGGQNAAGIGAGDERDNGTVIINGGDIRTTGGHGGAGIGGGYGKNGSRGGEGGTITINGGIIEAYGGYSAAGIGGGKYGSGGKITINNGTIVIAKGLEGDREGEGGGAGIGGGRGNGAGDGGTGGTITINGGTIELAQGGRSGAGIGGGWYGRSGYITITGDAVIKTAQGGYSAAGIGGGEDGSVNEITISGGRIEAARGGFDGAGIGGGFTGSGGIINIKDDAHIVLTEGGGHAAGIGGGGKGNGGEINISGGNIETARGGTKGAGIGGGYYGLEDDPDWPEWHDDEKAGSGGKITISGGKIDNALGGNGEGGSYGGAGIGGGGNGSSGTILITGEAHIEKALGDSGAGIGSGGHANVKKITIEGNAEIGYVSSSDNGAGIGGGCIPDGDGGEIIITGGKINAKAYAYAAAIGGGNGRNAGCRKIIITGGEITAAPGEYMNGCTGIGSGAYAKGNVESDPTTIEISGGTITAKGSGGAGIGSGMNKICIVTITGGTITARNSGGGAGIGSGMYRRGGEITISGGTIDASGGWGAAGIGGGGGDSDNSGGSGGTIKISGANTQVKAEGGTGGAGIGGGLGGDSGNITIDGATVTAQGWIAAGIGGGWKGAGKKITINDGKINARGVGGGSGIGGGGGWNRETHTTDVGGAGGTIIINGGEIEATGEAGGAGIGGGPRCSGGTIQITGGTVKATGEQAYIIISKDEVVTTFVESGAGIGGGYQGAGGNITISGGTVMAYTIPYAGTMVQNEDEKSNKSAAIGGGAGASCGSIKFSGGKIMAKGQFAGIGCGVDGTAAGSDKLTLTYSDSTMAGMSVKASSYSCEVKIDSGKTFIDGDANSYTGTLTEQNKNAIAGKTIVPGNANADYYIDAEGNKHDIVPCEIITGITIEMNDAGITQGWYVAKDDASIGGTVSGITVAGKVNLILHDNYDLSAFTNITLFDGAELTIWAQSTGTDMGTLTTSVICGAGSLIVNGGSIEAYGNTGAGIDISSLTVNAGSVDANGTTGIIAGGMTVTGGSVHAVGTGSHGIFINNDDADAVLTVTGGNVTAKGASGEDNSGIFVQRIGGDAKAVFQGGTVEASGEHPVYFVCNYNVLEINNMAVYDEKDSDQPVKASKRADTCYYSETGYAKITACTHDSLVYVDNHEGKHTANCDSCSYSDGKLYDHNYVNHFCVCGAEQPNHKVTFYANNGTADSAEQKVYDGEETQLKANSFSWADHEFAGWNSEDNGSGTPYAADAKVTFAAGDEDLVLYGQWTLGAVNAPQITADPGNLSLTYGEEEGNSLSVTAAADEGCTLTYQWYSYTKEDKSDIQAVAGAQSGQYVIPAGTNAGTYFFYCEVTAVRTEDSQTSEPAASKAAKVEIAQREAEVTVEDAEDETYDGGVHTGSSELSFTGILEGHTASITYIPAKGSAPSTYTGSFGDDFKVVDGDNNDVTGNYKLVKKTPGSITVTIDSDKPVITVKANSTGPLAYDGKEHSAKGFETLTFEFNGYKYTVEGLSTTDPSGTDVCSLSNEIIGDAIVRNAAREDVTAAFDVYTENGCLQITQRKLTVTANDKTAAYNGAIQGPGDASYDEPAQIADMVTADGLQGDDKLTSVEVDGQGTDAGEYALIPGAARVNDDDTATGNYDIHYVNGKLTIGKAKLTITAKPQTYEYTGEPQGPAGTYTADFDTYVEVDGLQGSDALSGITLSGAETDAGVYEGEVVPSGAAVTFGHETEKTEITDNYDVTYVNGDLTINAAPPGVYEVVSGADGTWTKGSTDTLQFIVKRTEDDDKTFGCFAGLEVNGTAVPEKDDSGKANYTAEAGSVIIDLQPSFLETLAKGKNTIALLFTDGDPAEADFTILTEPVKPTPSPTPDPTVTPTPAPTNTPGGNGGPASNGTKAANTGDDNPIALLTVLFAASALGLALAMAARKRRG